MHLFEPYFLKKGQQLNEMLKYKNAINERVPKLMTDIVTDRSIWWSDRYMHTDSIKGHSSYILFENEDHTNCIMLTAWAPSKGTAAHNHHTWAVVTGVFGTEINQLWRRVDDRSEKGIAKLEKQAEIVSKVGHFIHMKEDDIHSVINQSDELSLSLQIYGKNPNFTDRLQFNPDEGTCHLKVPTVQNF